MHRALKAIGEEIAASWQWASERRWDSFQKIGKEFSWSTWGEWMAIDRSRPLLTGGWSEPSVMKKSSQPRLVYVMISKFRYNQGTLTEFGRCAE